MMKEMFGLIKAEQWKIKHTVVNALTWIAPLIVMISCYFMNIKYFYSVSLVWWYTIFVYIIMALMCSLCNQKEDKKLQYRNVYQLPLSLKKVWRAKNYMIAVKSLAAANILSIMVCLVSYITFGYVENGVGVTILAVNIIWILNIWQIPVYLMISKKCGFYIPFIASGIFLVIGIGMSTKSVWWLVPVSWASRVMCSVIGYMPNGLKVTVENQDLITSYGVIAVVMVAGAVLYMAVTFMTSHLFERGQKKC